VTNHSCVLSKALLCLKLKYYTYIQIRAVAYPPYVQTVQWTGAHIN